MKLNFKTEARSQKPEVRSWPSGDFSRLTPRASRPNNSQLSTFNLQPSQRGIALVITLILLAVTLVMALAFLFISRRESSSVTTAGETATARLAADAALANAEAQAVAGILSAKNPYNFGPLVSTNYLPATTGNSLQDLANLFIGPRPPVFIPNPPGNYASPNSYDFRFYLDLNRNGSFDSNGYAVEVDNNDHIIGTNYNAVGDPEWIGVLEHPDQPYGPDNPFIARYAFIALPVGNALDLNYIHNQVFNSTLGALDANDGFFRNEGVGSWEINLAAFLADLNTNEWDSTAAPYIYGEPANINRGAAFDDASALLAYRYNYNYNSLATVQNLYGPNGVNAFEFDGIDGYSDGPLQTTFDTNEFFFPDYPNLPWAGADNTNHFFAPSDLFDPTKSSGGATGGFTNRLLNAGAQTDTYDRETFYRLLSQLGTDSDPESGKMNLNYDNIDPGFDGVLNTNGTASATNFVPWTPLGFFTSAADRMLREYTAEWINENFAGFTNTFGVSTTSAFGVGNIPVYVNGQFVYTPAVNRILQLAANIYDATVSNRTNGSPDYPDVFRPTFWVTNENGFNNLYINGYTHVSTVSGPNDMNYFLQPADPPIVASANNGLVQANVNVYGVPWIIGAKKGFPNFNEISMENNLAVTRRLQITRPTINSSGSVNTAAFATNQMYTMSMSSSIGVELWNSYSSNYPGTIQIAVNENAWTMITNYDQGLHEWALQPFSTNVLYSMNPWPGAAPWSGGNPNPASFVPITFTGPTLTNSVYRSSFYPGGAALVPTNIFTASIPYELSTDGNGFNFPQFGILLTNRLQVFMLSQDSSGGYHVIDYVHFDGPDSAFNVNAILADVKVNANDLGVWDTNYPPGSAGLPVDPNYGILNQIAYSKNGSPPVGNPPTGDGLWQADPEALPANGTIAQQQAFFGAFFKPGNTTTTPVTATNLQLSVQAPYSPTRYISQYATWQVNDPLVHYLASDIDEPVAGSSPALEPGLHAYNFPNTNALTSLNLGRLNDRYMPWGGNPALEAEGQATQPDSNGYNSAERDPLASSSDNWDFPTNKLPTTGWVGRVHRGTPWQTVYLKASDILAPNGGVNTWAQWTGDTQTSFNQYFDAANSAPAQDRLLFDLFTTAFNDNATRGTLSVNQSGLAAWSALLSGVVVLTNNPFAGTVTNVIVQPAGVYDPTNPPPLVQIWQGINNERTNFVNADKLRGSFEHVGDILSVPQVTEQSPFINTSVLDANGNPVYPGDEVMEWLPQQVMSLLRVGTPRYVIYSYGQALKPAPNGIYLGSATLPNGQSAFRMVTNYQIVAETATRTVVRFDSTVTNINNTLTVTNNRAVIESYNILPPD